MRESERAQQIRSLLSSDVRRVSTWFKEVCELTEVKKSTLLKANKWPDGHGQVIGPASKLTWIRGSTPGIGPNILDSTPTRPDVKTAKFYLMGELSMELRKCGLLPYVEALETPEWRNCRVFIENKELDKVVWACAITGTAARISDKYDGPIDEVPRELLVGRIEIVVESKPLTIF